MQPLFESSVLSATPAYLEWYIPEKNKHNLEPLLLVGKPIGLYTHRVGRRTLPCLEQWPRLGIPCPHCERSRRWTCWVPLTPIKPPRELLIIMGGETTWKSIEPIPKETIVTPYSVRVIKPTIAFKRDTTQLGKLVLNAVAKDEIPEKGDITRWLLHYWQWPLLSKLFDQEFKESLKTRAAHERSDDVKLDLMSLPKQMHIA